MLVSFVVIAYNEDRNLRNTVEAILGQPAAVPESQRPRIEVVVVNDGSTDDTLAVARALEASSPLVRVVDQANAGRGAARAAGVAAARGNALALVDGDILLPPDWLARTLPELSLVDAVGGVPVPDGDVAYVHRAFELEPKPKPAAVPVTGSNGLFRRSVFAVAGYNPRHRNGEDVALMAGMRAAGLTTRTLNDLLVVHREHKSLGASVAWLFESGCGATRQLHEQRTLRLPDLVTAAFWALLLLCVVVTVLAPGAALVWLLVPAYVVAASVALLHGRFSLLRSPLRSGGAVLVQGLLLLAYFVGRVVGLPGALRAG